VEGEEYWKVNLRDGSGAPTGTPDNPVNVTVIGSTIGTPYLDSGQVDNIPKETETLIYGLNWTDTTSNLGVTALRCKGEISALFKVVLIRGGSPTPDTFTESKFGNVPTNEAEFRYWGSMRLEAGDRLEIYVKHKYKNALCFQTVLMGETLNVT